MRASTTRAAIPFDRPVIADTSALIAASTKERGHERLRDALTSGGVKVPAPVVVEFERVTALDGNVPDPDARAFLSTLFDLGVEVLAFDESMARAAADANSSFGSADGRGSPLNLLDLMVYGVAKVTNLPILCTGKDFARTDIAIHPASRVG